VGAGNEGIAFATDATGAPAIYVSKVNLGLAHIGADGNATDFSSVPSPIGVAARSDGSTEVLASSDAFRLPANGAVGFEEFGSHWLYVTNLFGTTVDRVRLAD